MYFVYLNVWGPKEDGQMRIGFTLMKYRFCYLRQRVMFLVLLVCLSPWLINERICIKLSAEVSFGPTNNRLNAGDDLQVEKIKVVSGGNLQLQVDDK